MLNISHYKCIVLALPSSRANTYLPLQPSAGYPANFRQSTPSTLALPHGMALSACSLSEVAAVLSAVQVGGAKVTRPSFIGVRLLLPHARVQISRVIHVLCFS